MGAHAHKSLPQKRTLTHMRARATLNTLGLVIITFYKAVKMDTARYKLDLL